MSSKNIQYMSTFTKAVYIVLFAVLLLQPHLVQRHIFLSASPYVQNAVTIFVFVLGILTYLLHRHDVKRQQFENRILGFKLREEQTKLLDSLKYIGTINLRLPLLQNLTSDLLNDFHDIEHDKKIIFERLLRTAVVSIMNTEWGALRIVHEKCRTLKEFSVFRSNKRHSIQLSNNELLQLKGRKNKHLTLGDYSLIVSSNNTRSETCFFVMPKHNEISEENLAVLCAIVDQAYLFYAYIYPAKPKSYLKRASDLLTANY